MSGTDAIRVALRHDALSSEGKAAILAALNEAALALVLQTKTLASDERVAAHNAAAEFHRMIYTLELDAATA